MTPDEAKETRPTVVFVDGDNKIKSVKNYEKHGMLED